MLRKFTLLVVSLLLGIVLLTSCEKNIDPITSPVSSGEIAKEMNESKINLIGTWQYGGREVGAGYNHLYMFNDDGTYKFQHSQYDGESREIENSGNWSVENNKLRLEVKKRIIVEGGQLEDSNGSVSSQKEIVGGRNKDVEINPAEVVEYNITNYDEIYGTVLINGEKYWSLKQQYYNTNSSDNKTSIDNLKSNGYEIIENQCFDVNFESFGKVRFISATKKDEFDLPKLYFYLTDSKGDVINELPKYGEGAGVFFELKAVAFDDLNKDGLKDIVILSDYILGHGENAADPFKAAVVYFQRDKTFVNLPDIDEKINSTKNNNNINQVKTFAGGISVKF